ncbi:MAG: hypothetical protein NWQ46_02930 [Spirosomaceae bacterium]|nr:hypothetical protein [Spirosomataceae bacterium]
MLKIRIAKIGIIFRGGRLKDNTSSWNVVNVGFRRSGDRLSLLLR